MAMSDTQTMSNEERPRKKYWVYDENGRPMGYDEDAASDDMIAELLAWTMERKKAKSQPPPTE